MDYINKDTGLVVTVLSETPTVVTFSVKGGGFVCRFPRLLFQADFEPLKEGPRGWSKGFFELDGSDYSYEGYTARGKWNGFETPWFTLDVAMGIVRGETSSSGASYTGYDPQKDIFFCVESGERFDMRAENVAVDGTSVRLYEVSDGWCWYRAQPKPEVRPELAFIKDPIDSEQAAKNYLRQLHRTGFAFHPEDDPIDIERNGEPLFNGAEMEHLAQRQEELFKHLDDPCAYALWLGKRFEIRWIEGYGEYDGTSAVHPASWFSDEGNGFDDDDLREMDDLEVGREVRFSNALSLVVVRRTA